MTAAVKYVDISRKDATALLNGCKFCGISRDIALMVGRLLIGWQDAIDAGQPIKEPMTIGITRKQAEMICDAFKIDGPQTEMIYRLMRLVIEWDNEDVSESALSTAKVATS